ncbi:MAG: hypothetical protein LUH47_02960 [Clostridiales bacterium]|nr:hypothetical protein [Clostridiales bacterium]
MNLAIYKKKNIQSLRKIDAGSFLEFCLALLLVLNCNSVYDRMTYVDLKLDYIMAAVSLLLVLSSGKSINRKAVQLVFLLYIVCIIYFIGSN